LGLSGKNFIVILISTLAVMKSLNIATKIYLGHLAAKNALKTKEILLAISEGTLSKKELITKYGLIKAT
jgi:hypothetical protein